MNPAKARVNCGVSYVAQWLPSNLLVIEIGWHLVLHCEHVTLLLLRLLIRHKVAKADRREGTFPYLLP